MDVMLLSAPVVAAWVFAFGGLVNEGPPPSEIVGGTDCTTCEFPASVFIGSGGGFNCTASLVHPRVIITANHCLGGITMAGFGESAWNPAYTVGVEYCDGHDWFDLAYCVLSEDAPPVAMVPVIMGCEVDELVPGKEIYLAGFGQSDEVSGSGGGTKRWTTNTVDSISYDYGSIYLNGSGTGSCYGDSGGPAYVQLSDGTWRVIAAVQGPHPNAPPLGCGHGGTYTLIHTEMDWIEAGSGYDITPCFDADGTWNPSEACRGFPTELRGFGGAWGQLCDGATLSGASSTCGPGVGDPDPPGHETGDGGESGDEAGGGEAGSPMTSGGPEGPATSGAGEESGGGSGDPNEDDEEDPGQADSNGGPQSLPPAYGHHAPIVGCRVGERSGAGGWFAIVVIVVVRRATRGRRVVGRGHGHGHGAHDCVSAAAGSVSSPSTRSRTVTRRRGGDRRSPTASRTRTAVSTTARRARR